jgi:hypothetical protein
MPALAFGKGVKNPGSEGLLDVTDGPSIKEITIYVQVLYHREDSERWRDIHVGISSTPVNTISEEPP